MYGALYDKLNDNISIFKVMFVITHNRDHQG